MVRYFHFLRLSIARCARLLKPDLKSSSLLRSSSCSSSQFSSVVKSIPITSVLSVSHDPDSFSRLSSSSGGDCIIYFNLVCFAHCYHFPTTVCFLYRYGCKIVLRNRLSDKCTTPSVHAWKREVLSLYMQASLYLIKNCPEKYIRQG